MCYRAGKPSHRYTNPRFFCAYFWLLVPLWVVSLQIWWLASYSCIGGQGRFCSATIQLAIQSGMGGGSPCQFRASATRLGDTIPFLSTNADRYTIWLAHSPSRRHMDCSRYTNRSSQHNARLRIVTLSKARTRRRYRTQAPAMVMPHLLSRNTRTNPLRLAKGMRPRSNRVKVRPLFNSIQGSKSHGQHI